MSTTGHKTCFRPPQYLVVPALCCLVPLLMGGCKEFRNDVVGVFETATRSALLSTDDEATIANAARVSLVDATISLVFGALMTDEID